MWAHAIITALGIWLMASPDVLDYHGAARTNDYIIGPLIATLGCIALWEATRAVRWVNLLLGIWLVLAPALLGHEASAAVNSVVVGLLTAVLALVRGAMRHEFAGGWVALFPQTVPQNIRTAEAQRHREESTE